MPKRKADAAAAAPAAKKPKGAAAPAKTTTAKKGAAAGAAAKKPAKGGVRPQIVLAHAAGHHPKGGTPLRCFNTLWKRDRTNRIFVSSDFSQNSVIPDR